MQHRTAALPTGGTQNTRLRHTFQPHSVTVAVIKTLCFNINTSLWTKCMKSKTHGPQYHEHYSHIKPLYDRHTCQQLTMSVTILSGSTIERENLRSTANHCAGLLRAHRPAIRRRSFSSANGGIWTKGAHNKALVRVNTTASALASYSHTGVKRLSASPEGLCCTI